MTDQWKAAVIGALGGATISLAIVFGASAVGLFPNREITRQTIHDYLLEKPEMLPAMYDALQEKQAKEAEETQKAEMKASQAAIDKLGPARFLDPRVAFVIGPANAKTTVVEFFDYNCPYCRASLPGVKAFYEKHKDDTRFAFIEFPIKGENSVLATRAMLAAQRQPGKYLPFHFALMSEKVIVDRKLIDQTATTLGLDLEKLHKDMDAPQIASDIARVQLLAKHSKINATPTFIVNGKLHLGAVNEADLAKLANSRKS